MFWDPQFGRTWTRKCRRRAASCSCRRSSLGLLRYFTVSCTSSAMLPASCAALALALLDRPTGCTGTRRAGGSRGIDGMSQEPLEASLTASYRPPCACCQPAAGCCCSWAHPTILHAKEGRSGPNLFHCIMQQCLCSQLVCVTVSTSASLCDDMRRPNLCSSRVDMQGPPACGTLPGPS